MANKECEFYSNKKCIAADLELCDYNDKDYKKCLRYRLYFLNPQVMGLK